MISEEEGIPAFSPWPITASRGEDVVRPGAYGASDSYVIFDGRAHPNFLPSPAQSDPYASGVNRLELRTEDAGRKIIAVQCHTPLRPDRELARYDVAARSFDQQVPPGIYAQTITQVARAASQSASVSPLIVEVGDAVVQKKFLGRPLGACGGGGWHASADSLL